MSLSRPSLHLSRATARLCSAPSAPVATATRRALSTHATSSPLLQPSVAQPAAAWQAAPPTRPALCGQPARDCQVQRRHHAYNLADAVGSKRFRDFDLSEGVYVVTGGARGLGLTMAQALAEAGGKVYCLDRLEEPHGDFHDAAAAIPAEFGGSLAYARVDVRDAANLDRVIGAIASKHQRLDGIIAAAGVQQLKPAVDYKVEELRDMMDINYSGVFMTATAAARQMFKWNVGKRNGAMVLIASMSGSVANKGLISPVYNSSKAAVVQLTRNLAMEWSGKGKEHPSGLGGIRVNSLSPGNILTPMVRKNFEEVPGLRETWERENMMGRISRPEEFKGAALFMLSRASSFMTGSNLIIDGGYTAW